MKTLRTPLVRFLLILLLLIPALGCQLLTPNRVEPAAPAPGPAAPAVTETAVLPAVATPTKPPEAPAAQATLPPAEEAAPANSAVQGIQKLLEQQSIKIRLNLDWSDGSMRRYSAEIDARGSLHLTEQAENSPGIYPEMPDIALMSAARESYRVDGKVYRQDGETAAWTKLDDQPDPLARLLQGSTGPGLWLSLLPEASLNPDGEEAVGGFNAEKYTIAGKIDDVEVLGTVWIDKDTRALVKVDLTIPGALLADPSAQNAAELTIQMDVEKGAVAEIQVP